MSNVSVKIISYRDADSPVVYPYTTYYTYLLSKVNPFLGLLFCEKITAYTDALEDYSFVITLPFILSHLFFPQVINGTPPRASRKNFLVVLTLRGIGADNWWLSLFSNYQFISGVGYILLIWCFHSVAR